MGMKCWSIHSQIEETSFESKKTNSKANLELNANSPFEISIFGEWTTKIMTELSTVPHLLYSCILGPVISRQAALA